MYQADKDKFSRFIIELDPRMKELGVVLSVDVTAPDGDANWSLCYDRNVIGHVADYLIFMHMTNMELQAQNQEQQQDIIG
jgi:spore germination protein YaaH